MLFSTCVKTASSSSFGEGSALMLKKFRMSERTVERTTARGVCFFLLKYVMSEMYKRGGGLPVM